MSGASLNLWIPLIAGHLIGDFLFQNDLMVANKKHVGVLIIHAVIVTSVTYLLCGYWTAWQIPAGVFLSHIVIDGIKTAINNDGAKAFLIDQGAHFFVLLLLSVSLATQGVHLFWLELFPFYSKFLLWLSGAFLSIQVGGFWVGKAVASFQESLTSSSGLPNAGRLIGQLERALIFILVLAGQTQGVGFLVTAKSILRFGEVKESGQQKDAEYIIIGTLMSFGWALAVAYGVKYLWGML